MTHNISRAAVIGAGTMGGGIAALLANVGIPVVLLDIPTPDLSDDEKEDPEARNRLVNSLYQRMISAKPANLGSADRARLITVGNTEDNFDLLADVDWVVEVIIERLGPKQALMARLEDTVRPGTIITSNTSGIPIGQIADGRSDSFKKHFMGTHFFNPPRYLKLMEVIPTEDTDPAIIQDMVRFGREVLGKGVVVCKDTPNFIGNRLFALSSTFALEHALEHGFTVPEIDAITGPVIGRPKTATFRLMDLIGVDVMGHVNGNLHDALPLDPYRDILLAPAAATLSETMVSKGYLGNKSGKGYYQKKVVDGRREFWVLNLDTMEHERPEKVRFDSIGAVRNIEDLGPRIQALLEYDDRAANYVRAILYFGFAYAAHVAPEIAFRLSDIDDVMRWGFGFEAGPFELWDMLGVAETAEKMEESGLTIAGWVREMLDSGHASFYKNGSAYDFDVKGYRPKPGDKNIVIIDDLRASGSEVDRNDGASLLDLGDGVALLEFHTKMNVIDEEVGQMGLTALQRLDSDFDALVVANDGPHFSLGANLFLVGAYAAQGQWDKIEDLVRGLQEVTFAMRHAPKPVVTAVHGMALGGGTEMAMGGWETVAAHESYMGLVEFGVGLVPAGGGSKEIVRRKINPVMRHKNADVLPIMQEVFEQLALAKVGTSAWENKELGYLRATDEIVMNPDYRIAAAKRRALQIVASGARPPEVEKIYAAGRDVYYALLLGVQSLHWGGYASEHDALVADKLAYVLCGGDLSTAQWVDPWYILDLEREAIVSLLGEEKTRERIVHMLQTGKPLRN